MSPHAPTGCVSAPAYLYRRGVPVLYLSSPPRASSPSLLSDNPAKANENTSLSLFHSDHYPKTLNRHFNDALKVPQAAEKVDSPSPKPSQPHHHLSELHCNRRLNNRSAPPGPLNQSRQPEQQLPDSLTGQPIMGGGREIKSKSSYPALASRPVGQWISNLYKDRINQFYSSGQWEKHNLL
ncbi:putative glycosyl hydrolase family 38, partial [Colletotrichum sublineola]